MNTAAQSETITELIDVALDMSDTRRREILAMARALVALEQQESTPLQKITKKVISGENPPVVIGEDGEEDT